MAANAVYEDDIIEAIAACDPPDTINKIADSLKGRKLLPEHHFLADFKSVSRQARPKKVKDFMTRVSIRIRSEPLKYNDFLEVLEEHGLSQIVETLKKQYRES